jgi:hypothetical protein
VPLSTLPANLVGRRLPSDPIPSAENDSEEGLGVSDEADVSEILSLARAKKDVWVGALSEFCDCVFEPVILDASGTSLGVILEGGDEGSLRGFVADLMVRGWIEVFKIKKQIHFRTLSFIVFKRKTGRNAQKL